VISLSVPIKPRNVDYSLVETIAVPFLDSSTPNITELCTVEISHQLVVIERSRFSTNAIPIDSAHSSRCSLKTRLCFYNEFSSSSRIATDCMRLLLAGSTAQYLREACPFHCRPARINDTSVISLESKPDQTRIFAVTNPPPNSAIICEFKNGTIASDTPVTFDNPIGSYLISISNCLCHIRLNTRIIRMTHPCRIHTNDTMNEVRILIPSRWTNLTSSYILLADTVKSDILSGKSYSNISEINVPYWKKQAIVIDNSWTLKFKQYSDFSRRMKQLSFPT
jgi:hypothetical protein